MVFPSVQRPSVVTIWLQFKKQSLRCNHRRCKDVKLMGLHKKKVSNFVTKKNSYKAAGITLWYHYL